jgi:hypothetical protein
MVAGDNDGEQFAVPMERKIMHLLFSPGLASSPVLANMIYYGGGGLGLVVLIIVIVLILR